MISSTSFLQGRVLATITFLVAVIGLFNNDLVRTGEAFNVRPSVAIRSSSCHASNGRDVSQSRLQVSTSDPPPAAAAAADVSPAQDDIPIDYETPEDAIINIKPKAMMRLRELRDKEQQKAGEGKDVSLVLRMGVRNGGCSGLSYVMDFSSEDKIQDDDQIDEYPAERLKCVVDAKSMLYLYGLEVRIYDVW
jgi:Fe-S cluster assembly iron-binding protein IscA